VTLALLTEDVTFSGSYTENSVICYHAVNLTDYYNGKILLSASDVFIMHILPSVTIQPSSFSSSHCTFLHFMNPYF